MPNQDLKDAKNGALSEECSASGEEGGSGSRKRKLRNSSPDYQESTEEAEGGSPSKVRVSDEVSPTRALLEAFSINPRNQELGVRMFGERPEKSPSVPVRVEFLLENLPSIAKETQIKMAWNPADKSDNIMLKKDGLIFHRHAIAQRTDGVRGKVGFSEGLHIWEIKWPCDQRGTNAVIGVATQSAPLQAGGYLNLTGNNDQSWGWDIAHHKLCHDSVVTGSYPVFSDMSKYATFSVPNIIWVILDMDEGTLAFLVDGQYLGVAFRGLRGKKLFPMVSAVWGGCEVRMKYKGGLYGPASLEFHCKQVIRESIGDERMYRVNELQAIPAKWRKDLLNVRCEHVK